MSATVDRLEEFVRYSKLLKGDEKGEAQVFCDRLFQGFGHKGYKEAGAELEFRVKKTSARGTSFADLMWKPKLLIEMKKGGERLHLHQRQAFDYWLHAVPNRPKYVVLCNFSDFWIYDFDKQLDEPVDKVSIDQLSIRYNALNFLFPDEQEPIFGNDREVVSRDAAAKLAQLFNLLTKRGVGRDQAQRFVLQLVVAMFAEDIDLLPSNTIAKIVRESSPRFQNSYDLLGGLFAQMNNPVAATGGRFKGVPFFNGGLFSVVNPIELLPAELHLLSNDENTGAADQDWSKVNPAIFGTLFQRSMDKDARHAYGAHYTSEADILRIVTPTIVKPWEERIDAASTLKELVELRTSLGQFRVLDPACGSGNFLYVAYREMARLETLILSKIEREFSAKAFAQTSKTVCTISAKQFFGVEQDKFGVELAKVTLMLARKLANDEAMSSLQRDQSQLDLDEGQTLPLDNLDSNFVCGDALFEQWPAAHAVIGNPPFQSKNKILEELGLTYINRLRAVYSDIPGHSDYCVYWLRKTHDHLEVGQRAGLVGTNTIRQNYSREGGLDYVVSKGGTITEAVSSMPWSGDAAVHVSVVNWIKGDQGGQKRLYIQVGADPNSGWSFEDRLVISSALSFGFDVTKAQALRENARSEFCAQGQTHGHRGFLLDPNVAKSMIETDSKNREVIFPFLIANDLLGRRGSQPSRFVIDFSDRGLLASESYSLPYRQVKQLVLPTRVKAAKKEDARNKEALDNNPQARTNVHHGNFLKRWWIMSYRRAALMKTIEGLPRYIACARVTKRPIFEFVSNKISPNDALVVFPFADDYSFGVLQSTIHWSWFTERCSTLTERYRYTSNSVFDSFPWPQKVNKKSAKRIGEAARALYLLRRELCDRYDKSLRSLYREAELPGEHELSSLQADLDAEVSKAYGMAAGADHLKFLFELNQELYAKENSGQSIVGPGLPKEFKLDLVGQYCVKAPGI